MRRYVWAATAVIIAIGVGSSSRVWTQVLQSGDRYAAPTASVAVRAARLFDAKAGTILQNQVILIGRLYRRTPGADDHDARMD